jgi:NADH dehydrogenase/NADH:ubiquinone oxidoreductase subunit G
MPDDVTITIDGKQVTVPPGTTILEAARSVGVEIPVICFHEATTSKGLCRTCVVEIEGWRVLAASCVAPVAPGMVIHTQSDRVMRSRRTILEMLNSAVDLSEAEAIQQMMSDYDVDPQRFPKTEKRAFPLLDDNPMFVRDYSKCVLCWRCVQVCAEDAQYTFALSFDGRGFDTMIGTFFDRPMPATTCVFCGQCVGVCPTNALKPKRELLMEQGQSPEQIISASPFKRKRGRG